jgi:predicted PurR-regulated permease PerM
MMEDTPAALQNPVASSGSTIASAKTIWPNWLWPLLIFGVLAWLLFSIRAILLPFVAGLAVAYLLDPLTDRLERWHAPRWLAALLTLIGFFGILLLTLLGALPIISVQFNSLIEKIPSYINNIQPIAQHLLERFGGLDQIRALAEQAGGQIASHLTSWVTALVSNILVFY